MTKIIDAWKKLENVEKEHQLFDEYKKAREEYLLGIKKTTKGNNSKGELEKLFNVEQKAFSAYYAQRSL